MVNQFPMNLLCMQGVEEDELQRVIYVAYEGDGPTDQTTIDLTVAIYYISQDKAGQLDLGESEVFAYSLCASVSKWERTSGTHTVHDTGLKSVN